MNSNIDRELTINFVMMIVGILVALWNVFAYKPRGHKPRGQVS